MDGGARLVFFVLRTTDAGLNASTAASRARQAHHCRNTGPRAQEDVARLSAPTPGTRKAANLRAHSRPRAAQPPARELGHTGQPRGARRIWGVGRPEPLDLRLGRGTGRWPPKHQEASQCLRGKLSSPHEVRAPAKESKDPSPIRGLSQHQQPTADSHPQLTERWVASDKRSGNHDAAQINAVVILS